MALKAGDINASFGMSKAIYDQLDKNLMTEDDKSKLKSNELKTIQDGWRKLAYGVAQGVCDYLGANLEVGGIKTKGNVKMKVSGSTKAGLPGNHTHEIDLQAEQDGVEFTQSNDGTGHIK